jgi:hypothetical protein
MLMSIRHPGGHPQRYDEDRAGRSCHRRPVSIGTHAAITGVDDWTRFEAENWIVAGLIWGCVMSFAPEHRGEEESQRNLERIQREGAGRR